MGSGPAPVTDPGIPDPDTAVAPIPFSAFLMRGSTFQDTLGMGRDRTTHPTPVPARKHSSPHGWIVPVTACAGNSVVTTQSRTGTPDDPAIQLPAQA